MRFPIAAVEVRRARDPDRARRAAELRLSRRFGLDWRMRANVEAVELRRTTDEIKDAG